MGESMMAEWGEALRQRNEALIRITRLEAQLAETRAALAALCDYIDGDGAFDANDLTARAREALKEKP